MVMIKYSQVDTEGTEETLRDPKICTEGTEKAQRGPEVCTEVTFKRKTLFNMRFK